MAFELLLFLLCLGIFSSEVPGASKVPSCHLGYELMLSNLEAFKSDIQQHIQYCKENSQKLTDQKNILDELLRNVSRLLKDTSLGCLPESCRDVSGRWSGARKLQIEPEFNAPFEAYCDQKYEGGGWTVIQNRFEGKVDFKRDWHDYEHGFGDLKGEFWLGLKYLHQLTAAKPHELHVVLEDFDGKRVVAKYSHFVVGSAAEKYSLKSLGTYSGDAGDSLEYSVNRMFSTFDSDNDLDDRNCALTYSGAWWYNKCHQSNLNGLYVKGDSKSHANMMCWNAFRGHYYGLKSSRMMIRATD